MNTLVRWGRFNLVGAMGMGVQLGALALFNRWAPGHYLFASAAAIEVTLLHNSIWHLNYTWRDRTGLALTGLGRKGIDRRDAAAPLSHLMRFQFSNGLVSMVGNLVLMRVLVQEARLPLLAANGIAIVCCSLVNFCLGDRWVFAERGRGH